MHLINHRLDKWFWLGCILLMSGYIVYEHATSCLAVDLAEQIARHKRLIAGESEFYNPWQYRIFSALLLEGIVRVFAQVAPGQPEIMPYLFLHFIQLVIILYLSNLYFKLLEIRNPYLILSGLLMICYMMANSVFQSDLSFNTYFDIIFYLLAACLVLSKRYAWIIPVTLLAVMNRETSGFIPLMALAVHVQGVGLQQFRAVPKKIYVVCGASLLVFIVVFAAIRVYYGYREPVGIHGMRGAWDYLSFNIGFFRMYPELVGTLGIMPLIVILKVRKLPLALSRWFWLIVPFWFVIHLVKSTAMETRLFLVPQLLVFVPSVLWLIDNWAKQRNSEETVV